MKKWIIAGVSGCGCLSVLLFGLFCAGLMSQRTPRQPVAQDKRVEQDAKEQTVREKPESKAPQVEAALSNFKADRSTNEFIFQVQVKNLEPRENTVYVVVYGKKDNISPPRRAAWPAGGVLFRLARTDRGLLSPSDISRSWGKEVGKDTSELSKGAKVVLAPNGSDSLEGVLPANKVSTLNAWKGQQLDMRSPLFDDVRVWVFSEDGKLVFEKKHNIK